MALPPCLKPLPLPSPPRTRKLQLPTSRRFCSKCSAVDFPESSSLSSSSVTQRPAVILPGLGNNTGDYQKLALTLQGYGVSTVVANVSRIDWLRNAAGLVDPNYWRGTLQPRPVLDWYLNRVDEAVNEALEQSQGGSLSIIGHSAGGWLARVYMEEFTRANVSLLLTLGSPLQPPPKGLPGVIDQTRGLLTYVEKNCRKAVYTPELRYVCIAGSVSVSHIGANTVYMWLYILEYPLSPQGLFWRDNIGAPHRLTNSIFWQVFRYVQGSRFFDSNSETNVSETLTPTFRTRFVGQGYKQVCGRADVWGDGVVPEMSAHLEGALNISLDGVYHSPVGSDDQLRPWYGSPPVVEQWVHHLLE